MEKATLASILPSVIGGLIIFLYAIRRLSLTLQEIFSSRAKALIEKYTSNIFLSILIGTVVTIILDSSSAVIIITIIFINAGSLNLKQAMGIIMGANLGTTFSSQLIALNINKYAVVPLFIGFFIWLFIKSSRVKKIGEIVMYFGLLFFGLYMLETLAFSLKNKNEIANWISEINNPVKGAAIGGLITLIIQSSSATIGMLIVMAKQHLIALSEAISIMLGAELGTCSDTIVAVIGGKKEAIRAGLFQIIFNLVPIILGLLFFENFIVFIEWIWPNTAVSKLIANTHVIFSVLSILLFLPFVKLFHQLLYFIIPHK
ncbi:Na/Pi symporter [Flaviramulus sp. BrNp1-15]|uniref:Na/Pi cotransporter family protein n=1 Tax=Flaviramulus sp. BrNp1-15 TaxID=2916754 RepID=UPI001EE84558|nr:Na/Pi symporter [Flaviramulus sp. BrNp1-15]ULC57859.1 Na/Pi symporter [Flaviramulus sp. BrNp1-15]